MSADALLNIIRREAGNAVASREFSGTLVVTAYDPTTYAVKGMIMPHEVESGWIRMTGAHIGDQYGMVVGPKVGTADDLSGDQFVIEFDRGDPNTLIATHRIFSDVDQPPSVPSGEILLKHGSGTQDHYFTDGSRTMLHATGSTETWDAQGNKTVDALAHNVIHIAQSMKDQTGTKVVTGIVHLATG